MQRPSTKFLRLARSGFAEARLTEIFPTTRACLLSWENIYIAARVTCCGSLFLYGFVADQRIFILWRTGEPAPQVRSTGSNRHFVAREVPGAKFGEFEGRSPSKLAGERGFGRGGGRQPSSPKHEGGPGGVEGGSSPPPGKIK